MLTRLSSALAYEPLNVLCCLSRVLSVVLFVVCLCSLSLFSPLNLIQPEYTHSSVCIVLSPCCIFFPLNLSVPSYSCENLEHVELHELGVGPWRLCSGEMLSSFSSSRFPLIFFAVLFPLLHGLSPTYLLFPCC